MVEDGYEVSTVWPVTNISSDIDVSKPVPGGAGLYLHQSEFVMNIALGYHYPTWPTLAQFISW